MKKLRRVALGLVFCSVFLVSGFPALAHSKGHCADHSSSERDCQYELGSYTQAPSPTAALFGLPESKGVRLDGDASYVLFNNYPFSSAPLSHCDSGCP